jgi:predicted nucleotidyltransferase
MVSGQLWYIYLYYPIIILDFGVSRIVAFGSITSEKLFHVHSDIDLAVWGLDEHIYFRTVGALQGLDVEFNMDLIRFEDVSLTF